MPDDQNRAERAERAERNRSDVDLTNQLAAFHAARQQERRVMDNPFLGAADGPLRVLREAAADLTPHIRANAEDNMGTVTDREFSIAQAAKVAEEAGEAVKAQLRWVGISRTPGSLRDYLGELADTVITAFVAAESVDGDLAAAIERRLGEIYARGWSA